MDRFLSPLAGALAWQRRAWAVLLAAVMALSYITVVGAEEIHLRPVTVDKQGIDKPPNKTNPAAVQVSPDGQTLFAYRSTSGKQLFLYTRDALNGSVTLASTYGFPPVLAPRFGPATPDSRYLFVADSRSILCTFELDTLRGTIAELDKVKNNDRGVIGMVQGIGPMCLTPDGKSLYVVSCQGTTILCFDVDPKTGKLTFLECLQSTSAHDPQPGIPEPAQVKPVAGARQVEQFKRAAGLAASPDGKYLLVASHPGNSIVVFSRDTTTRQLKYHDRIVEPKDYLVTNVRGVADLAFRPDGTHVVVCSIFGGVTLLKFDPDAGTLKFLEGYVDDGRLGGPHATLKMTEGLDHNTDVEWSPDGKWVFTASYGDHAIVAFRFDANSERLIPAALVQQDKDGVQGLFGVESLAVSPDGKFLYAGSRDATAAVFEIVVTQ